MPEERQDVRVYPLGADSRAVIKRKSNVPLVTIAIAARGGVHNETAASAGLTSLMSRTSIKGTATRSAAEIAEEAERMGSGISPTLTPDVMAWEISVPSHHFEDALELLSDVAFNPVFPPEDVDLERKLLLADVLQSRDDMYRYPLRLCLQLAFRDHAYGNTISQIENVLSNATRADVIACHTALRPHAWAFVVGDVDPDAAAAAIAARFPSANGEERLVAPKPEWHGGASEVEERDKAQTALAIGLPGPARNSSDVYPLQIMINAIGGLGGRLFEELRSKRSLAYTVALSMITRWLGGAVTAYIATAPEREDEARRALLEQIERLTVEPLPIEDVQRSQRYTLGTWQIRRQTNSAQVSDLTQAYLLGSGIDEINEIEARIRAVTPESILEAARRYFDPGLTVQGIIRGKDQPNGS